jgi:ribonucleoside-diphosphate reductase alpha chain
LTASIKVPQSDSVRSGGIHKSLWRATLYPYESCNLGSINLGFLIKDGQLDYADLDRITRLSVRFLDDVIERNPFPLKQIDDIVKNNRRIGLGVMGWADLLFQLRIPYQSDDALALAEKVMQFIEEVSHDESRALAKNVVSFRGGVRV